MNKETINTRLATLILLAELANILVDIALKIIGVWPYIFDLNTSVS